MRKSIAALRALIAVAALALGGPAQALTITVTPAHSTVNVGDSVSVALVAADLASADLTHFELDLGFDNSVLGFQSYSLGTGLNLDPHDGDESLATGGPGGPAAVNLAETMITGSPAAQPTSFTLATVTFTALQAGLSPLAITGIDFLDGALPLSPTLFQGVVEVVTPVPLPPGIYLFATGLLALVRWQWGHRAATAG